MITRPMEVPLSTSASEQTTAQLVLEESDEFCPELYNTLLDPRGSKHSPPLRLRLRLPYSRLVGAGCSVASCKRLQACQNRLGGPEHLRANQMELRELCECRWALDIEVAHWDGSHIQQYEVDAAALASKQVKGQAVVVTSPEVLSMRLAAVGAACSDGTIGIDVWVERKFPLSQQQGGRPFVFGVFLNEGLLALSPAFFGRSNQPTAQVRAQRASAAPVKRKRRQANVRDRLTPTRSQRYARMASVLGSNDRGLPGGDADFGSPARRRHRWGVEAAAESCRADTSETIVGPAQSTPGSGSWPAATTTAVSAVSGSAGRSNTGSMHRGAVGTAGPTGGPAGLEYEARNAVRPVPMEVSSTFAGCVPPTSGPFPSQIRIPSHIRLHGCWTPLGGVSSATRGLSMASNKTQCTFQGFSRGMALDKTQDTFVASKAAGGLNMALHKTHDNVPASDVARHKTQDTMPSTTVTQASTMSAPHTAAGTAPSHDSLRPGDNPYEDVAPTQHGHPGCACATSGDNGCNASRGGCWTPRIRRPASGDGCTLLRSEPDSHGTGSKGEGDSRPHGINRLRDGHIPNVSNNNNNSGWAEPLRPQERHGINRLWHGQAALLRSHDWREHVYMPPVASPVVSPFSMGSLAGMFTEEDEYQHEGALLGDLSRSLTTTA